MEELIGIFIITWSAVRVLWKYLKNIKSPQNTPLKMEFAEALSFALDFKLDLIQKKKPICMQVKMIYRNNLTLWRLVNNK